MGYRPLTLFEHMLGQVVVYSKSIMPRRMRISYVSFIQNTCLLHRNLYGPQLELVYFGMEKMSLNV